MPIKNHDVDTTDFLHFIPQIQPILKMWIIELHMYLTGFESKTMQNKNTTVSVIR